MKAQPRIANDDTNAPPARDRGLAHARAQANGARRPPKPRNLDEHVGQRAESASPLLSELEFVGCDPVPVNYRQYLALRDSKRRFELWDRGAGTAWELRDGPTGVHEWPIQVLHEMMVLMGAVRGVAAPCYGSRGLALLDEGERVRVLHPDQSAYLNRPLNYDGHGDIPVREVGFPDIVMEVDNTTDTRRGKLKLYEDMGVPELWIEVPEPWLDSRHAKPPRRPRGLTPGLSILLLEGGRYREHRASRALLGWKVEEIHHALNDLDGLAARHCEVLAKIGRHFGERTGTGPDDNPMMRLMRQQSRDEGRSQGLVEGRTEAQGAMVRQILERRGIALSRSFAAELADFAEVPADVLIDAALACTSEQDFHERLRRQR